MKSFRIDSVRQPVFLVTLAAIGASVSLQAQVLQAQVDEKLLHSDSTMVIAHRGCWQEAPENSLAALRACIDLGVDMVELDVRRTSDGVLVLMHDETVDRTTDGRGPVSSMSHAEIRGLRLRNRAGGAGAGVTSHKVPTLREAMRLARNRIMVNVDAKSDVFEDVVLELTELDVLDHVVMKLEVPPDHWLLRDAPFLGNTHFMPKITQGGPALSKFAPAYSFTNPVAFELKFETEAYVLEGRSVIEGMDARIWVNTLEPDKCAYHHDPLALQNPDAHWGRLIEMGVNMIQTDYPAALLDYLQSR